MLNASLLSLPFLSFIFLWAMLSGNKLRNSISLRNTHFSPEAIKEILGHCHLLHMLCYLYKVYILILILAMDSTRGPKYWSTLLVTANNWNWTKSTFEISWYWTATSFILSTWIAQGKFSVINIFDTNSWFLGSWALGKLRRAADCWWRGLPCSNSW